MKKYNLSAIMTAAWKMKKSYSARSLSFAECLRRAWNTAKSEMIANSFVSAKFTNNMDITVDGYTRTLTRWTKGDYDRIYINGGSRNGDGFVDLKAKAPRLRNNCTYAVKIADIVLTMQF